MPTDVCSVCGHTRDTHRQPTAGYFICHAVSGCSCGPDVYPYHIAGWWGEKDTITAKGVPWRVDQPRPPDKRMPKSSD